MKVTIKSAEEIEKMRRAGEILAAVHQNLAREIKPGMSTLDIDRLGEEMIRGYGCIPSFKNYCGYPASICVSVNEEVVHGIPTDERIIKEGDIVSLDAGVIYEGYHSDAARTVAVGEVSEEAKLLIERTRQSFIEGMKKAVAGNHLYDISAAIGDYANQFGYGVVEDLCGHGIGSHLHEEPEIPNFRQSRFRRGIKLKPGMTLAGRIHAVESAAQLGILKYHGFQRRITGTHSDSKQRTVDTTCSVQPCSGRIVDCFVKIIVSMPLNLGRRNSGMCCQTVNDSRHTSRNYGTREVYPISHRIAGTYLDRNLVLILQFHQFHTERNYKSVNIGTCDILKMTARTDAGLQTVADHAQVQIHNLPSCHFHFIENMVIRTADKNARLAETQVFDQLKVLFAGTNPGSDFRKLIATFHTFIYRVAVFLTI